MVVEIEAAAELCWWLEMLVFEGFELGQLQVADLYRHAGVTWCKLRCVDQCKSDDVVLLAGAILRYGRY